MRTFSRTVMLAGLMLPLLAGCGHEYYQAGAVPAPPEVYGYYNEQPGLAKAAGANGFRDGYGDGARDRDTGHSFRPGKDDKYEDCPGYYEQMGPRDVYKQYYRAAYQHGYRDGYSRG